MPPTLVEPRANSDYSAVVLAEPSLAALHASGAPAFVAKGEPAQIVWANAAAFSLFETVGLSQLSDRLFGGRDPGAKRLLALAQNGLPGQPPRMERLRFFLGLRAEVITFLCRRVALNSGATLFAAAAFGLRPSVKSSVGSDTPNLPLRRDLQTVDSVKAELTEGLGGAQRVRFVWHSDAASHLTYLSSELAVVVGTAGKNLVGRRLVDIVRDLKLDPSGDFAAAIVRGETFRGIELQWPIGALDAVVPVTMGALPDYDSLQKFCGFRGFGIVHVNKIYPLARGEAKSPPAEPLGEGRAEQSVVSADGPEPETKRHTKEETARAEELQSSTVEANSEASGLTRGRPNVVYLRPQLGHGEKNESEEEAATSLTSRGLISGQTFIAGRPVILPADNVRLSLSERNAFREIARALSAHVEASFASPLSVETPDRRQEPPAEDTPDLTVSQPARVPRNVETQAELPLPFQPEASPAVPAPQRHGAGVAAQSSDLNEPPCVDFTNVEDAELSAMQTAGTLAERSAEMLLNELPFGLAVVRASALLFVNRALLQLVGYSDPDSLRACLDHVFANLGSLKSEEETTQIVDTADGEVTIECRAQTINWSGSSATLLSARRSRLTEFGQRFKALEFEVRMKEAETRELHAILDTATDGVVVLDEKGRVLSLNRSAEALFGYEENDVTGESITILLSVESQRAALDYLDGLKANGFASVLNDGREVIGRERQGGAIPLFMTIGRVGSGTSPKFCAVLRDMTQWKKAERELNDAKKQAERASALKSDFLAKISHEIRTPLNAILGFAEVIMEERFGPVGNDRYKDYLKDIHASGTHVMSLVNDLLDLSKIEAGKLELTFASVDANRVVRECVSLMQTQASSARVVVRQALAPRLPNIVADERSLRQIVLNLLSNAMKFNEPGGQVIVSTALTDVGHAVIRIRDTGIGMSENEIEMALEPFRQITTAHRSSGTGLGLPLTKALVEANRASFTIKSRRKEGTLVEVAFPPTRVLAE